MKRLSGLLALVLVAALGAGARADLAFDTSGGTPTAYIASGTGGYTFTVNSAVQVTELDMYAGAGLASASTPVGIWDSTGTLVVSAVIDNLAPQTTTPSAAGGVYNGAFVGPVVLDPGSYTIGAFGSGADTVLVGGPILSDPRLTYGSGAASNSGSLVEPTTQVPGLALFGPSFQVTPASVPEPASLTLLGAGGVALLTAARRRRAR